MNPIAEDVYSALEDVAQNKEEEEQIENARKKHLVKERYSEAKVAKYVAWIATVLPVAVLAYAETYTTPQITGAALIVIGGWVYYNRRVSLLNDARIDYYCDTEVIEQVKDND